MWVQRYLDTIHINSGLFDAFILKSKMPKKHYLSKEKFIIWSNPYESEGFFDFCNVVDPPPKIDFIFFQKIFPEATYFFHHIEREHFFEIIVEFYESIAFDVSVLVLKVGYLWILRIRKTDLQSKIILL